jgi:hypothetical protein
MDIDQNDEFADYDDDRSENTDGDVRSVSDDGDEEDEESVSGDEDVAVVQSQPKKDKHITYLTGNDRLTLPILQKYERCSAVTFYANRIKDGGKVPKIVKQVDIDEISDTITLAYMSVMSTVRKSFSEVKSEQDISDGASIMFTRKIKDDLYEKWALHELVWTAKELDEGMSDYDLIDSSQLKLGEWYKM